MPPRPSQVDTLIRAARKVRDGNSHHPTHLGGCIGPLSSLSCDCGITDLQQAVKAFLPDSDLDAWIVVGSGRGFSPHCRCGWVGPLRAGYDRAFKDLEEHWLVEHPEGPGFPPRQAALTDGA